MAEAGGIAIGADGNPVDGVHRVRLVGANCAIVAVKLNGTTGAQIWRQISPAGRRPISPRASPSGADGHAVVAGATCIGAGNSNCQGKVFKFNGATGVVICNVKRGTNYQMLFGVAVVTGATEQQQRIVTGVQCAATSQSCNIVTSQLNATTGAQVSTTTYNAGEPLGYFSEIGWGVRIGTDGLPVMTGVSCLVTGCDFRTIKYTSTTMGTVSWNQLYNSGGANLDAGLGGDIAIANDNRSVITGSSCTVDYPNCVGRIRKLNTTGA